MPYKNPEDQRAANRRYEQRHPDRLLARHRRYNATHHQQILEYSRAHRDEMMAWRAANSEHIRAYNREKWRRYKEAAYARICAHWGDTEPRCRFDTLPDGHPLKNLPCFGNLEIDHMNGHGWKELKRNHWGFRMAIASGKRSVDDLRFLCLLHQLWNRGDEKRGNGRGRT